MYLVGVTAGGDAWCYRREDGLSAVGARDHDGGLVAARHRHRAAAGTPRPVERVMMLEHLRGRRDESGEL